MGFQEKATEAITSWHKMQSGDPEEKVLYGESREKSKNEGNSVCRNALPAFTPCQQKGCFFTP
jgi:hypothetical protein